MKETPFQIVVHDGMNQFLYQIDLPPEVSIYEVIETVAQKYGKPTPEGKWVLTEKWNALKD